jgi:surface protein
MAMGLGIGIGIPSGVLNSNTAVGLVGFVFDVDTTQAGISNSTQFQLPLPSPGYTVNAEVDWGDGSTDTITSYNQAEKLHTYSTGGTYTITITGTLEGWDLSYGENLKIKEVKNWGDGNGLTLTRANAFVSASNMTCIATDKPNVQTTSFQQMFRQCTSLVSGLKNWDVSGITTLLFCFYNANVFNEDLSGWDVSSVTTFKYCFERCYNLDQNFASWDMSSATDVGRMFKSTTMSTANYDATLIGWASQSLNSGLSIDFGNAKYTAGGAAEAARNTLINTYSWTVVDGGAA